MYKILYHNRLVSLSSISHGLTLYLWDYAYLYIIYYTLTDAIKTNFPFTRRCMTKTAGHTYTIHALYTLYTECSILVDTESVKGFKIYHFRKSSFSYKFFFLFLSFFFVDHILTDLLRLKINHPDTCDGS